MNKKQRDEISKFLSYVLRHEPHAIGIQLDSNGWANIDELIQGAQKDSRILDRESIQEVVDTNEKKRFSISDDGQRIRAAQGHSTTAVSLQHVEKEPPEFLYHGTATRFMDSINEKGLIPGSRHHVHLSQDEQTAIEVGKRYGKPVVLKIEALQMHQQGFKFFQADNGVWLADHIPINFIQENN
ncbi:RNA 2'-phosphotransferase [Pseudomonas segetis]